MTFSASPAAGIPATTHTTDSHSLFLATQLQEVVLGFTPAAYAQMNKPPLPKYTTIHRPLSRAHITAHLTGKTTLAAALIAPNGLAKAAVLDIDTGGEQALQLVLQKAEQWGFTALAQTSTTTDHDGGHVWLLFTDWTQPERLKKFAETLAQAAGVQAQAWPTRMAIRLPLGKHTYTEKRGALILQDGTHIDLDSSEQAITTAISTLAALPRNPTSSIPPLPAPVPSTPKHTSIRPYNNQGEQKTIITAYNHTTDLISLLEQSGGRVAQRFTDGGCLMRCPCPGHKHHDSRPSLEIRPAKNPARYGQFVAYGYAPSCSFHTKQGQVIDAFGAYCILEHLTPAEAIRTIRSSHPHRPIQLPPRRQPSRENTQPNSEPKTADKRSQQPEPIQNKRIHEAHTLHEDIRSRAATDASLPKRAQLVLEALLTIAKDRTWCRPSIARLADMVQLCPRTIFRAITDLEERGYIQSDPANGQTTTIRRFLRVTAEEEQSPLVSPVLEVNTCTPSPAQQDSSCEPPRTAPAAVPPVPEVVAEPGGASYNPADDWTYTGSDKPVTRTWQHDRLPKDMVLYQQPSVSFQQQAAPPRDTKLAGYVIQCVPRDPEIAAKYHSLHGKARKVAKTNPKQAQFLRRRADALREEIEVPDLTNLPLQLTLDNAVLPGDGIAGVSLRGGSQVTLLGRRSYHVYGYPARAERDRA
jgi:hypothetical protein